MCEFVCVCVCVVEMEGDVKEHRPKGVLKYSLLQSTWRYNLRVCGHAACASVCVCVFMCVRVLESMCESQWAIKLR